MLAKLFNIGLGENSFSRSKIVYLTCRELGWIKGNLEVEDNDDRLILKRIANKYDLNV
jgi:hypothetical protein